MHEAKTKSPPRVSAAIPATGIKVLSSIFRGFPVLDTFEEQLDQFKAGIGTAEGLTPLMPLHISRRLIENTFTDLMAQHQLLSLSSFMVLLESQYKEGLTGPAGHPARWAMVNAVLALGIRLKTAQGFERDILPVAQAFFENATAMTHKLILNRPTLLSIQALLAMALYAEKSADRHTFATLARNASCQLHIFSHTLSTSVGDELTADFQHVCGTVHRFNEIINLVDS